MNPKEKAIALIQAFIDEGFLPAAARIAALITVDELIKYHDDVMDVVRYELPSNIVAIIPYKYWDKVKQELELL